MEPYVLPNPNITDHVRDTRRAWAQHTCGHQCSLAPEVREEHKRLRTLAERPRHRA